VRCCSGPWSGDDGNSESTGTGITMLPVAECVLVKEKGDRTAQ
jgi:hypothetical protein